MLGVGARGGPARLDRGGVARYRALSAHRAGIRCAAAAGEVVEGSFAGFDERGFLRLDTAQGQRLMAAGEVVES